MRDALQALFRDHDRIIRVIGQTRQGARSEIEVTLHEGPLQQALVAHGRRILYISGVISLATAALLFLAVQWLIVRPIGRVVEHMTAYRDDPMDASRTIAPQSGARELREAETALHDLEVQLTAALRQKERLAGLGAAVAKISHDLRNILTTAQLLADRIEASSDPAVRRTAPKLVGSLARAISLCERTLTFGKAEELPPEPVVVALAPLVAEVLENERAAAADCVSFAAEVPMGLTVRADADQLFRVLSNLVRNATQAIEAGAQPGTVTVTASEITGHSEIRVRDTGPGLPQRARDNLFQPFRGSVRQGGSGLGLVIAADLVRGHGGTLVLEETGSRGSTFRISLPAPGVDRRAG
jgi:signal transduction histidine kinase